MSWGCTVNFKPEAVLRRFYSRGVALKAFVAAGVFFMGMGTVLAAQNYFFSDVERIGVECRVEASEDLTVPLKQAVETTAATILKRELPPAQATAVTILGEADERLVHEGTLTVVLYGAVRTLPGSKGGSLLVLGLSLFRSGPQDQYRERYPAAPEAVAFAEAREFSRADSEAARTLEEALERMLSRAMIDVYRPRQLEQGMGMSQ